MSVLGIFILTTAIGIESTREPASESSNAYKALIKATYIQTDSEKLVKEFEKKYIPKIVKEHGLWITTTTKVIVEKKISMEWTF